MRWAEDEDTVTESAENGVSDVRKSRLGRLIVIAAIAAGVIACGDGVLADGDDVVYLTPFNHDAIDIDQVRDRPPSVAPPYEETYQQDQQDYEQINSEFIRQADQILSDPQVIDVLGSFERSFVFSGRYLEMVSIYQQHQQEYGTGPVATPALGWAFVRLGNEPGALAIIDELLETRPDDPNTWVIVAKFHGRRANQSMESARQARRAYERILELDPEFSGFKTMDIQRIERELEALHRIAPPADDDRPAAEASAADQPMHHADERRDIGTTADVGDGADDESRQQARGDADRRADDVAERAQLVVEELSITVDEYIDDAMPADMSAEEMEQLAAASDDDSSSDGAADDDTPSARELVARGQRHVQRGSEDNLRRAEEYFEQALEVDPENIDAGIGLLQIAERTGAPEEMLTDQVDTLSDHELSAEQAYQLGLFSLRRLNDRQRATSLLRRVEQLDPSFARRVGIDSLVD